MTHINSFVLCCSLLLTLTLSSCNPKKTNSKELPLIAVTLEPQRYFTEAIAGDKFKVISMVPKNVSPETYDITPQQLVLLSQSKAYFRIGFIGFEQAWMDRLANNAPHIQIFKTFVGIDFMMGDNHCTEHKEHQEHKESNHQTIEPHLWNSTKNALVIAQHTRDALCMLDKKNTVYYNKRYTTLCQEITQTDSIIRQNLAKANADRTFMIYHPALTYYARDYGLHQFSIEEDGKEPSPAHLKTLIERCKSEKIHVLFVQPEFDKRHAEIIAEQTGMKIVPINPLSYDWKAEMINVSKALSNH